MNKALTVATGLAFATLLVSAGFVLGALAEMRYQESESHDFSPETCPECAARQKADDEKVTDEEGYARMVGRPGFTE